ncbi:uncharacterized protein [Typha latifolia]|uniref:uncharacterized protein n=1 Tax=Typha latifolia TaxID=4733 RepID=UPI003C2B2F98
MQKALKAWSKEAVGSVEMRLKVTQQTIEALEAKDASAGLNVEEQGMLRASYNKKCALSRQINLKWLQRSQVQWVKDGDRNTKFYHLTATIRRQQNRVAGIQKDDGQWVTDHEGIKECFQRYYLALWGPNVAVKAEEVDWNTIPTLPTLTDREANNLVTLFSTEEIKEAVWSLHHKKAPGPDGLQAEVFTKYWETMGTHLYKAILTFFEKSRLPKQWGDTFITLIPKKEKPVEVKDFRPISLCNTAYKVIVKLLVGQMKPLLCKLIGPEQSAFVSVAKANKENVEEMRKMLEHYSKLTNQKVNSDKSKVFLPPWMPEMEKNEILRLLDRKPPKMSFTYLGVKISGARIPVRGHQELVERVRQCLAGWKRNTLSLAGRITLVQSTLLTLPYYWLGATWIPDSILETIMKIARAFIWEKGEGHRGLHLLRWETMTKAKQEGGMALRCLQTAKVALMDKHVLSVLKDRKHLG